MPLPNPAINPPRLPSTPYHKTQHSRSPSRSPVRNARNFHTDPLLRDLSPTSTLRAFTSSSSEAAGKSEDDLARSIETASKAEIAFGIRVAQACRDLKAWCAEVEQWEWPGSFNVPQEGQRRAKRRYMLERYESIYEPAQHALQLDGIADEDGVFWGCLPSELVEAHEARIESIRDDMDEMELEELKSHVLRVHIPSKSQGGGDAADLSSRLQHLDDFTALVTATTLQALPFLSRLDRLLSLWDVRLMVLRKIPGYLRDLQSAEASLESAWAQMARVLQDSDQSSVVRHAFETLRGLVEVKVTKLGRRLDSMLDDLEGREETIPDDWIDRFEKLETEYGVWVTQMEDRLSDLEWVQSQKSRKPLIPSIVEIAANTELPDSAADSPVRDGESPVLGAQSSLPAASLGAPDLNDAGSSLRERSLDDRSVAPTQSRELAAERVDLDDISVAEPNEDGLTPEEPSSVQMKSRLSRPFSPDNEAPPSSPPQSRSRHVPIVVDYNDHILSSSPIPSSGTASPSPALGRQSPLLSDDSPSTQQENKVKIRAAFLNSGGFEMTQKLLKPAKTPVRPFEHASQAVAKLFSKPSSPQHSRNNSTSSRSSMGKRKIFGPLRSGSRLSNGGSPRASIQSVPSPDTRAGADSYSPAREREQALQSPMPEERSPSPAPSRGSVNQNSEAEQDLSRRMEVTTPDIENGLAIYHTNELFPESPNRSSVAEFPENWPLGSMPTDNEIASPKKPIDSDHFEAMFVDSLPNSPGPPHSRTKSKEQNPMENASPYVRRRPIGRKEPSLDDSMLGDYGRSHGEGSMMDSRPATSPQIHRLTSNDSATLSGGVFAISEVPTPGSVQSVLSTPEVRDASAASYFRPQEVETPPAISRHTSTMTARPTPSTSRLRDDGSVPSDGRLPSPSLKLKIPEQPDIPLPPEPETEESANPRDFLSKRASVASIEMFSRSEVKTVNVQRSGSFSSTSSIPATPTGRYSEEITPRSPSSPRSPRNYETASPRSPRLSQPSSPVMGDSPSVGPKSRLRPPVSVIPNSLRTDTERSSIARAVGATKPPPLNVSMPKRGHGRGTSDPEGFTGARGIPQETGEPTSEDGKKSNHTKQPSDPGVDQFDRHVSEVLQKLPSRIKFTPIPSTPKLGAPFSPNPSGSARTRPPVTTAKSTQASSGLTLAPAPEQSTPQKPGPDGEIKLYHLSQPGKDQPIKLFIRLVGDNERVMVRVGGGWADLGEYLRQYAEHHGRRTASGGSFNIQAASGGSIKVGGSKQRTPLHRPGSALDSYSPRPESVQSLRKPSLGSARSPVIGADSSPLLYNTTTPTHSTYYNEGTAGSASVHSNSRPSTSGSGGPRPSSRQSWVGDEIGLAGPMSKRGGELNEQKAKWVEEMIERAKKASAEKKKMDEKSWGDMGRVGGTRRVVFKSEKGGEGTA